MEKKADQDYPALQASKYVPEFNSEEFFCKKFKKIQKNSKKFKKIQKNSKILRAIEAWTAYPEWMESQE